MMLSDMMSIRKVYAPQSRWEVWTRQPKAVVGYTVIVKSPFEPVDLHVQCATEDEAQALAAEAVALIQSAPPPQITGAG